MTAPGVPNAESLSVSEDELRVHSNDGRSITVPLSRYPRLLNATAVERGRYKLTGRGEGIRWESVDEDISVESLLAGKRSTESQASLKKWLATRKAGR